MQPEIIVVRNLDQVIDALGADALESEMLGPLIERVFGILTRLELLPEPPVGQQIMDMVAKGGQAVKAFGGTARDVGQAQAQGGIDINAIAEEMNAT